MQIFNQASNIIILNKKLSLKKVPDNVWITSFNASLTYNYYKIQRKGIKINKRQEYRLCSSTKI